MTVSKLEHSKARRRAAIIDAAHDLLREEGEAGVSMRALALRAGVSLATPYNLFGSKRDVLLAVLNATAASFGREFELKASPNMLLRLFDLVEQSLELYGTDAQFYQQLLRALYRTEDSELRLLLRKPRMQFIKKLVRDAIAAGYLRADSSVEALGHALYNLFASAAQDWVYGVLTIDEAKRETGFAYSVVLLGAASTGAEPELTLHRVRFQTAIEAASAEAGIASRQQRT